MKKEELKTIHACAQHILGHATTAQCLIQQKLDDKEVDENMWNLDLLATIRKIESELLYMSMMIPQQGQILYADDKIIFRYLEPEEE